MKRARVLALALLPFLCSVAAEPEVMRHTFVPSAQRRHGEVRLCSLTPAEGTGTVRVESVLFSTMLARGLHRIRQEESRAWPEGSTHFADSQKYLAALDAAAKVVLGPGEETPDPSQPVKAGAEVRRLRIVFEVSGDAARVEISTVELGPTDGAGPVIVLSSNPLQAVSVSPAYARACHRLMLAAAFDAPEKDVADWLAEAGKKAGL